MLSLGCLVMTLCCNFAMLSHWKDKRVGDQKMKKKKSNSGPISTFQKF